MNILLKYKRVIKFLVAGGTATLVNLGLLYFFTDILGVWYLISTCLAFICSFFVSFLLQKFWTFNDHDKDVLYKQMSAYLAVAVTNLTINGFGMYILVDGLKVWYMLAQVCVTGIIGCESYLVYNILIFNRKKITGNNPPRVLIATGIYPPDIGGPATMVEALARALADRGFKIKIITYSNKKNSKSEILNSKQILRLAEDGESRRANIKQAPNPELLITNQQINSELVPGQLQTRCSCSRVAEIESGVKSEFAIKKINKNNIFGLTHLFYFFHLLKLARWANVIYATDTYSVGYFSFLISKIVGKKYIIRFAGDSAWETAVARGATGDYIADFQEKKYGAEIEKLKLKRKKILLGAEKVIAVSNFMSLIAQKIGVDEKKIMTIYNSVDFMSDKTSEAEKLAIRKKLGGDKIIMTACRLTPWKGVDKIISILPEIKNKLGNIKLVIMGEGSEMENLKQRARQLAVAEQVIFLGKIDHDQVFSYYQVADLFILNSNYEGLSHTLMEVMKAGVPIIATDAGGNPELITNRKEGILVKYNNQEELSAAVMEILGHQDLARQFADRAKEKLNNFSWEKNINQTVELITKSAE